MKAKAGLLLAILTTGPAMLVAQSSYDLKSPDGRIEVRIRTAGQLRYDVVLRGTALLEGATLSLVFEPAS